MTNSTELQFTHLDEIKKHFTDDEKFTVKELSENAFIVTAKGKRRMSVTVTKDIDEPPVHLIFNVSKSAARILTSATDFPSIAAIEEWVTSKIA